MNEQDFLNSLDQENEYLLDSQIREYKTYLDGIINRLDRDDYVVSSTVQTPKPNSDGVYMCIKEPIGFLKAFVNVSNSKEDCSALFESMISRGDSQIIDQIIQDEDDDRRYWFNSTEKGLNLRPGLQDNESSKPTVVSFGKPEDNVHALIVGSTGSGKSVFLHNLLFSMMAEYAPWELNIYLIDFKKVSLSRYLSQSATPHIKAVAATSEVRYAVSLCSYLNDCMRARQTFLSYLGLEKLSQLREKYDIILPRVVLLVDEFQQMFMDATPREQQTINDLLTSITKLGRATGFHLIFASQEMNNTLSASAFANFKVRFALRCNADVSSSFLGNNAASTIEPREVGIVYENSVDGKAENNRKYKVPFIQEEDNSFFRFLDELVKMADNVGFRTIHKYYQEDFIRPYEELVQLLQNDKIAEEKKRLLCDYPNLFDILTLGDAVVFNNKKIDCETVFLEMGSKKNIGVFSPRISDLTYICRLLATSFKMSPNANRYTHRFLILNDLFERNYNIASDLGTSDTTVYRSSDGFGALVNKIRIRKEIQSLIEKYDSETSLQQYSEEVFRKMTELLFPDDYIRSYLKGEEIEGIPSISELVANFENTDLSNVPHVIDKMLQQYSDSVLMSTHILPRMLDVIKKAYCVHYRNETYSNLIEPCVFWIIGSELIERMSSTEIKLLDEAVNYNILFVIAGSAESDYFSDIYGSCDYLFVSGNQERIYDRWDIPYTNKSPDSKVIDFRVRSAGVQRSFKRFFIEGQDVGLPELDFDKLLFE